MLNNPFEEMRKIQREMNRLFDNIWKRSQLVKELPDKKSEIELFRQPLSDLRETKQEFIANIEIPGVEKKDIKIDIQDNNLKIKVERKDEIKIEKEGYLKAERSYKGFYRSIYLPKKVVPEKAKSSYKDGILEVIIPKAKREDKKRIEK